MERRKIDFVGDVMRYGPSKALSYLNARLKNDKTISNYLSNKKYNGLASVAKSLGYGRKRRKAKRRIRGGNFVDYVKGKVAAKNGISTEEAGRLIAAETGKDAWITGRDDKPGFFGQIGNAITNPRNWTIAGSIGKDVIGKIIAPVIAGKVPSPGDALNIVKEGVAKVNGGRRRRRVLGGRKIRIEGPINKDLLM